MNWMKLKGKKVFHFKFLIMHVKIQGGGDGKYSNSGSCSGVVAYLEHEDFQRMQKGEKIETFFSHNNDEVDPNFIIDSIDNNRKKLCKSDAKFFVLTLSFRDSEIKHLTKIDNNISERIKNFVRHEVMERYAENFNKNLKAENLMYFAKIHHERKKDSKNEFNHHCHIVISRKTLNGKIRISPMTNHINTKDGAVKGGFARKEFYEKVEKSFDNRYVYPREFQETFEFNNGMKKGNPDVVKMLMEQQYATKNEKHLQLKEIKLILDKLNLRQDVTENIMKGFHYELDGNFALKKSNEEIRFVKDNISIGLMGNQFELKIGNEKFSNWLEQFRLSNSNSEQNELEQNKRKRKFTR